MVAAQGYLEARNVHELTLRRVAELAGVSAPTVYAHFPTMDELIVEFYFWVRPRLGLDIDLPALSDLETVPDLLFEIYERHGLLLRNLLSRPSWNHRGEADWASRHAAWIEALGKDLPRLAPDQLRCGALAVSALWTPATWAWLIGSCGFSPEEARKTARWAIRSLVEALQRNPAQPSDPSGQNGDGVEDAGGAVC